MLSLIVAMALQAASPAEAENRAYVFYVAGVCKAKFDTKEADYWRTELGKLKPRNKAEAAAFDLAWQQGERERLNFTPMQCRRALSEAFWSLSNAA